MDYLPEQSDSPRYAARRPVAVRQPPRPDMALVSSQTLAIAMPEVAAPDAWQSALEDLVAWLDLDLTIDPPGKSRRFGALAERRKALGLPATRKSAPLFSPWQCHSPVALQTGRASPVPSADWLASYLLDHNPGKPMARAALDNMLASPHPDACIAIESGAPSLPSRKVMRAMIEAAKAEHRGNLAIIVPAMACNAVTGQLLLANRALTREGIRLDIVAIEDALATLLRNPFTWEAIIVTPELRSVVFAMLAEISGIRQPWPAVWHRGDNMMITSEALQRPSHMEDLDAPLLVLSLALILDRQGLRHSAQRLHKAAAQLWDRGVATPGRPSSAPYATQLSDAAFIRHMILDDGSPSPRGVPSWQALDTGRTSRPTPRLRLVEGD